MNTFVVGRRLRISALFKNADGRAFDPQDVNAVVTQGGVASKFSASDGIRRSDVVGECFVEVLLTHAGTLDVNFSSTTPGQEGTQDAAYEVAAKNEIAKPSANPVFEAIMPVAANESAKPSANPVFEAITPVATYKPEAPPAEAAASTPALAPPAWSSSPIAATSDRRRHKMKMLKLKQKVEMAKKTSPKLVILMKR